MSVLAVVTKVEDVEFIVRWSAALAASRESSLTVLCWAYAPTIKNPLTEDEANLSLTDGLVEKVQQLTEPAADASSTESLPLPAEMIHTQRIVSPDMTAVTLPRS